MKSLLRRPALAWLPLVLLAACQIEIQHELTEVQANEIIVLLERHRIPSTKDKEEGGREVTWKVSVPKAVAPSAMYILKTNELPRPKNPGLELFNKGSLVPTATEERAMFLQALSGELSRTLSSVSGVLDARVHVNLPQTDDLADKTARPEPSASVLLKYRPSPPLEPGRKAVPPITEEQVQYLVARAVQELKPQNVSVVLTQGMLPGGVEVERPVDVEILGIRMAADSVGGFKFLVSALGSVILVLAAYIVYSKVRELRDHSRSIRTRTES